MIMENYSVEVIIVTFLGYSSDRSVSSHQAILTQTAHYARRKSSFCFERINKVDRKILVLANLSLVFSLKFHAPALPCSKDGGMVNEVY